MLLVAGCLMELVELQIKARISLVGKPDWIYSCV